MELFIKFSIFSLKNHCTIVFDLYLFVTLQVFFLHYFDLLFSNLINMLNQQGALIITSIFPGFIIYFYILSHFIDILINHISITINIWNSILFLFDFKCLTYNYLCIFFHELLWPSQRYWLGEKHLINIHVLLSSHYTPHCRHFKFFFI